MEFKLGIYKKKSGKIVYLTKGESDQFKREVFQIYDGRRANNPIIRAMIPRVKDRPLMVLEGDSLGWGPTKYLNTSEYLGDPSEEQIKRHLWLGQLLNHNAR